MRSEFLPQWRRSALPFRPSVAAPAKQRNLDLWIPWRRSPPAASRSSNARDDCGTLVRMTTRPTEAAAREPRAGKPHRLFQAFGPGVITGAADDDPSGIAAYAQTGAQFGYGQLWTA